MSKCCQRIESYGTLDELSAHMGLLCAMVAEGSDMREVLHGVQSDLLVCGAYLASDKGQCPCITAERVAALEAEIDRMSDTLPTLRSFVLPGGCLAAAQAHVCRTVCRRAEREVMRLRESGAETNSTLLCYLNRLSDYLFVAARTLNNENGVAEQEWRSGK